MRLIDAPVGLFMCKEGELCLKTEYIADSGVEAYIVSSGETFWGGAKTAEERNNLEVTPVDAVPVVRCRDCKHWEKGGFMGGDTPDLLEYGGGCPYCRFARYESDFCRKGERKDGNGNG